VLISDDLALERLEIPRRLWRFCSVSDHDYRATVDIRTVRSIPIADLETLARLGVSLVVSPTADFDLRGLKRSLELFEEMRFTSVLRGGTYQSAELLESATRCRRLSIHGKLDSPVDLSRLANLRRFSSGSGVGWSASLNPAIEEFWMRAPSNPPNLHFVGRLSRLSLRGNSKVARLPGLSYPKALRHFSVSHSTVFDVESLRDVVGLRTLQFTRCREIRNIGVLTELPELEHLVIMGASHIPDAESLAALKLSRFYVSGNRAFDEEFRAAGKARGWDIAKFNPPK
jgi:hypothetical protein